MRTLSLITCLFALGAEAANVDCKDEFSGCNEDCLIEFGGSVRVELRKRYDKCKKKCVKKENLCIERAVETKSNSLEEGSLDRSPGSRDVDENGIPNQTPVVTAKKKSAPVVASEEEGEAVKPKAELRSDEIPKSSRTEIKSETPPPQAEKPKEETPVIKVEMKEKKSVDTDFRDDSASTSNPPVAKKVEAKKEEKSAETPTVKPVETPKKKVVEEKKENFDDWKDL